MKPETSEALNIMSRAGVSLILGTKVGIYEPSRDIGSVILLAAMSRILREEKKEEDKLIQASLFTTMGKGLEFILRNDPSAVFSMRLQLQLGKGLSVVKLFFPEEES